MSIWRFQMPVSIRAAKIPLLSPTCDLPPPSRLAPALDCTCTFALLWCNAILLSFYNLHCRRIFFTAAWIWSQFCYLSSMNEITKIRKWQYYHKSNIHTRQYVGTNKSRLTSLQTIRVLQRTKTNLSIEVHGYMSVIKQRAEKCFPTATKLPLRRDL